MNAQATRVPITEHDLRTRLYILADDSMQGREAGTAAELRSSAYIEREVRRMNLVPGGDKGTYFQKVPLVRRFFIRDSRLRADSLRLVGGKDYYPVLNPGKVRPVDGLQVVYAGNNQDTSKLISPELAKGRAVLVSGGSGGIGRRYPDAYAFIVVVPDAGIPSRAKLIADGTIGLLSDTTPARISLAIPLASVSAFLRVALDDAKPGLHGATLHGTIEWKEVALLARNVVAILPSRASAFRGQYVAIGSHTDAQGIRSGGPLDHDSVHIYNREVERILSSRSGPSSRYPNVGLNEVEARTIDAKLDSVRQNNQPRRDSINNGADDNASGAVALLEIAESMVAQQRRAQRSILFIWHTAEETSLIGSRHFSENPSVSRDSIVAYINMDMVGRDDAGKAVGKGQRYMELVGSRRLSTELGDLLEHVNIKRAHNLSFDYRKDAPGHPSFSYCRSDHVSYARFGIPVVSVSTGQHSDHHDIGDEPQYISYSHLARVTRFIADGAWELANLDHRLLLDKPIPDPKAPCQQ